MNSVDRTDTMRRTRILRWASLSAALAACAAALAAVSLTGWSLFQPDTRYMVAIGRWIIENGKLPTSDPLTLHEGLAYICQQWPLCIAAAAIFDAFGDAVICDIDVGSELELAGYRPLLDTRAELYCPELNGGTDAWGAARHVLAGDENAIEGTGADFAVVPSGAYPALEDSLSGLGFSLVHDDGTCAVFARKPS